MAEICCGLASGEASAPGESSSRAARRRRMEIRRFKFVTGVAPPPPPPQDTASERGLKRPKGKTRDCVNAVENCVSSSEEESQYSSSTTTTTMTTKVVECGTFLRRNSSGSTEDQISTSLMRSSSSAPAVPEASTELPKFGFASVCGRRRDMEDALAIYPYFLENAPELHHYFGVYDGHGCSHVATKCRERLHELVKEEVESKEEWKTAMERSFIRMDAEVIAWNDDGLGSNCRCELQTPECDAVGSTAVVAVVTTEKIVVANCGDSRAVLCRNGKPVPLSFDHKPDRPDELNRIQAAGGRVIYWDGPRVLGVLAMSRAIGDNYLKPYVSCEPEVTIANRTAGDDCLILASDGLWDVVSNETACGVTRMCLRGKGGFPATSSPPLPENEVLGGGGSATMSDKACSDAAMLLTKLALARHSTDNVSVIVVDLRRDT
ncbi:Protein phosphatase 2C [Parasponia andersonii]|uniref:protein-serine/threonine phosphatase n=1 Tax=Parasponia andersonii TaxID=3476 RepID=A0A2P5BPT8_PARAD|nr:Protein phosphatase 2C [Parasponia andersonii]